MSDELNDDIEFYKKNVDRFMKDILGIFGLPLPLLLGLDIGSGDNKTIKSQAPSSIIRNKEKLIYPNRIKKYITGGDICN